MARLLLFAAAIIVILLLPAFLGGKLFENPTFQAFARYGVPPSD
jgi:hypothetical protein